MSHLPVSVSLQAGRYLASSVTWCWAVGRDVDPAGVPVPGDVHAAEGVEGALVDAVISVAYDSAVDVG